MGFDMIWLFAMLAWVVLQNQRRIIIRLQAICQGQTVACSGRLQVASAPNMPKGQNIQHPTSNIEHRILNVECGVRCAPTIPPIINRQNAFIWHLDFDILGTPSTASPHGGITAPMVFYLKL
jgi:hypothetical protein